MKFNLTREQEGCFVCLAKHVHDIFVVTEKRKIESDQKIHLWIESMNSSIVFIMVWSNKNESCLEQHCHPVWHYKDFTMTFTGTYIAMFAECGEAAFQYFKCKFQRGYKK